MQIYFNIEDLAESSFCDELIVRQIFQRIAVDNKYEILEISVIFCSDEYLRQINKQFLDHDYYTDIITFDYNDELIHSDMYISIDRVKENAIEFNASFQEEIYRVLIHGMLHLVGYEDSTSADKEEMRQKEDFYLSTIL
jgi:probable rRNA maturation factor